MKAVIFDLDGVIVSTDKFHQLAWKETADEQGIPFDESLGGRLRGVGRLVCAAMILEAAGKPNNRWDAYHFAQIKNSKYMDYLNGLSPKDVLSGVQEFIDGLKAAGIFTAIASSSKNARVILEMTGLTDRFDVIVDGTMIKNSKPDPEVFLKAAELLQADPGDCVVVEDAEAGIRGAKECGMYTIAVGPAGEIGCGDINLAGLDEISPESLMLVTSK